MLGSILSFGGGLLSTALGHSSQQDANRNNYRIAQMNNEWSSRMMDKQYAYQTAQWNREAAFALQQREYDSAQNQAARLRAAGLNPNLVMGGQNAGSAASTPSGSSVGLPSPSSATMQPYDFSGIARAFESSLNIAMALERNEAEVDNLKSMADYNRAKANFEAAEAFERTRNYRVQSDIAEFMQQINYDAKMSEIARNRAQESLFNAQDDYQQSLTTYQELINLSVPERLATELALMRSQMNQSEIAKRIADYERMTGEKLSSFVKKRLMEFDFGVDLVKDGKSILSLPNKKRRQFE